MATAIPASVGNVGTKCEIMKADVAKLHYELRETPVLANRVVAVLGTMYYWAGKVGLVPEDFNPTQRVEK